MADNHTFPNGYSIYYSPTLTGTYSIAGEAHAKVGSPSQAYVTDKGAGYYKFTAPNAPHVVSAIITPPSGIEIGLNLPKVTIIDGYNAGPDSNSGCYNGRIQIEKNGYVIIKPEADLKCKWLGNLNVSRSQTADGIYSTFSYEDSITGLNTLSKGYYYKLENFSDEIAIFEAGATNVKEMPENRIS